MNWIAKAKALPKPSDILIAATAGDISLAAPPPDPKDISVKLALDALVANGIMIKSMSQTTSYSYDGLELDLSMTILVDPKTGKDTLGSLNDWYFSKGKGW